MMRTRTTVLVAQEGDPETRAVERGIRLEVQRFPLLVTRSARRQRNPTAATSGARLILGAGRVHSDTKRS